MKFTAFVSAFLLLVSTCLVGTIDVDSHAWNTIATRVKPAKPVFCLFFPSSPDCTKF